LYPATEFKAPFLLSMKYRASWYTIYKMLSYRRQTALQRAL